MSRFESTTSDHLWDNEHETASWESSDYDCVTCGSEEQLEERGDVAFCGDCIDWARQDNLDSDWDDLGLAG